MPFGGIWEGGFIGHRGKGELNSPTFGLKKKVATRSFAVRAITF